MREEVATCDVCGIGMACQHELWVDGKICFTLSMTRSKDAFDRSLVDADVCNDCLCKVLASKIEEISKRGAL